MLSRSHSPSASASAGLGAQPVVVVVPLEEERAGGRHVGEEGGAVAAARPPGGGGVHAGLEDVRRAEEGLAGVVPAWGEVARQPADPEALGVGDVVVQLPLQVLVRPAEDVVGEELDAAAVLVQDRPFARDEPVLEPASLTRGAKVKVQGNDAVDGPVLTRLDQGEVFEKIGHGAESRRVEELVDVHHEHPSCRRTEVIKAMLKACSLTLEPRGNGGLIGSNGFENVNFKCRISLMIKSF